MSIRAGHGCRSVPRRAAVLAAAALLLAARNAAACAMCLSFQGAQRQAYYVTTLILLAVPLGIAGAFAFWLYRAARASRLAGSAGRGRAKTLPDAEFGSAGGPFVSGKSSRARSVATPNSLDPPTEDSGSSPKRRDELIASRPTPRPG